MTTNPTLQHWLDVIAPQLDCPTDPRGYRQRKCSRCGVECGLRFGRHSERWYFVHPENSLCAFSLKNFWGATKEEAEEAMSAAMSAN